MSLVLNTNIASLNAQNNLTGSQAQLSQSLQRLSSGLRINSAADDAAGLAISQQFTTQINGTNQAVSNANDAVSEAQTTAGALNTIVNNLQSIRTLAVESANGSNSASDRQALDNQVQQQIAEITQIAQQTTFNGLNVLNGSSGMTDLPGRRERRQHHHDQPAAGRGREPDRCSTRHGDGRRWHVDQRKRHNRRQRCADRHGRQHSAVTVGATANYRGRVAYQDGTSAYAKAAAINGAGASGLTASAANNQPSPMRRLYGGRAARPPVPTVCPSTEWQYSAT